MVNLKYGKKLNGGETKRMNMKRVVAKESDKKGLTQDYSTASDEEMEAGAVDKSVPKTHRETRRNKDGSNKECS